MSGRARSTAWAGLGQVSALVAGLANLLLLARLVGPQDYGVVAATWAVVLTAGPVALIGAERLVVRDVTRAAGGPEDGVRAAVGAALLVTCLGSAVALVVLALLQPLLLPQVPAELLLCLALADIAGLGVATCASSLLFSLGRSRAAGLSVAGAAAAKIVAVVLFAVVDGEDVLVWGRLYAVSALLAAVLQAAAIVRHTGRPTLRGLGLRRRLRDGAPHSGNNAALVVLNDADKVLLVREGYGVEAGHYSVAYRLASIASLPLLAVLQVTFRRFYEHGRDGGLVATAAYARRMALPLAGVAALAGTGLAVTAPLIPLLVGEQYRPSVLLLMLLAPLPFLRVLQSLASDALTGADRQGTRTAIVVACAAVNLGLLLLLLPGGGTGAAILATLVAESLYVVLAVVAVRRGLREPDAAAGVGR
ncbi:MAG: polysaccharide biosynthesis protein [Frankiales bacterium]|nr:polysaccharide biosynthesis protein [Frankiales bacterium]